MHAVIVANGDVPLRTDLDRAWPGWADRIDLVIAADGGAKWASALGLLPNLVVGDGDSLGSAELARLETSGTAVELAPVQKDESDTELAIRAALGRGATDLSLVGTLGGRRFDHAIANTYLLALPQLAGKRAALLDGTTRVTLLRADADADADANHDDEGEGAPTRRELRGRIGDLVSLLPLGPGVEGVETGGLQYPLRNEPLPIGPARGLSNVRTSTDAYVSIRRGLLLIVETCMEEGGSQ